MSIICKNEIRSFGRKVLYHTFALPLQHHSVNIIHGHPFPLGNMQKKLQTIPLKINISHKMLFFCIKSKMTDAKFVRDKQ